MTESFHFSLHGIVFFFFFQMNTQRLKIMILISDFFGIGDLYSFFFSFFFYIFSSLNLKRFVSSKEKKKKKKKKRCAGEGWV